MSGGKAPAIQTRAGTAVSARRRAPKDLSVAVRKVSGASPATSDSTRIACCTRVRRNKFVPRGST